MAFRNISRIYTTAQITDLVTRMGPTGTQFPDSIAPGSIVFNSTTKINMIFDGTAFSAVGGASSVSSVAQTATSIGLGSVDNTRDSVKPLSTLQAAAVAAAQSFAIQRGNQTGTQATSTIDGLDVALLNVAPSAPLIITTPAFTILKATHANRRIGYNSSTAGTATFDSTAGFVNDDGFRLIQEGTGAVTLANGIGSAFANPQSLPLVTSGQGHFIDAEWDSSINKLVITYTSQVASSGSSSSSSPLTGGTLTGALNEALPVSITATTATLNIGAAASNTIYISSGTTPCTAFDSIAAGAVRVLFFSTAVLFTYNAVNMITPGGVSFTTDAGGMGVVVSLGGGNWKWRGYNRGDGRIMAIPGGQSAPSIFSSQAANSGITFNAPTQVGITVSGTQAIMCNSQDKTYGSANIGWGPCVKEGVNSKQGVATLASGTVTVTNTAVTASSRIYVTRQAGGTSPGASFVSAQVIGASFTITSTSAADAGPVAWVIIEAAA